MTFILVVLYLQKHTKRKKDFNIISTLHLFSVSLWTPRDVQSCEQTELTSIAVISIEGDLHSQRLMDD